MRDMPSKSLFGYVATLLIAQTIDSAQVSQCDYKTWIQSFLRKDSCWKDEPHLATDLSDWSFASDQLTLKTFPIDKETRNYVRQVKNALFSMVNPTPFKTETKLAAFSAESLQDILDMHPMIVNSSSFLGVVSGNSVLPGSVPLAHRYGGHQFGSWAGQLGDGRAHLLGEYANGRGERWEVQLKGSGLTPYSRSGDGRAVIRFSVREFLASEAMFHLGLPTSRAATLAVSGDLIIRDQFYTGNLVRERCAVVLRLARSWLRFGSLEILTDNGEIDLLRQVVDFVIQQYFPKIDSSDPHRYLALYSDIVHATANMVAGWMGVGFAHGVCNTDNFSLLSVAIDYGPFRFMDEYDPDMVPNTSDDQGLYRFRRQPEVGEYNLRKLLIALSPLLSPSQRQQMDTVLQGYKHIYKNAWRDTFKRKLGIKGCDSDLAESVIELLLSMMADQKADYTMTFRQLGDWSRDDIEKGKVPKELWSLLHVAKHTYFQHWVKEYLHCIQSSNEANPSRRAAMHRTNPRYVLRNWIAQKAISAAENDDFSVLEAVQRALRRPFEQLPEAELSGFADPPPQWARALRVSCSS